MEQNIDNFLQIPKDSIFRLGIKDLQGNIIKDENGQELCLKFDLEDIELPLKLSKMDHEHKNNLNALKMKISAINKKPDKKGKYLMSANEEAVQKAIKEFFELDMKSLDMFIGEGNTNKILKAMNRKPYYTMYNDIQKMLEPHLPQLLGVLDRVTEIIQKKYSTEEEEIIRYDENEMS